MKPTPLFSVLIPTFDRPELLRQAVSSVIGQSIADWECIIIDDCSTLRLPEFGDQRVRIVHHTRNRGAAAALNTGAEHARGRYLSVLSDDDLWLPNRLQIAHEGLKQAPLAICWSRYVDDTGSGSGRPLYGDVADSILDSTVPSMGTVAIARERWLPQREDYRTCEDVEWWLRTAQATRVYTVAEIGYLVRRHDGVRHLSGAEGRFRDCKRLIADNLAWFDAHPSAHAFRLRRVGHFACLLGIHTEAINALTKSMRLKPTVRTMKQLLLAYLHKPAPLR